MNKQLDVVEYVERFITETIQSSVEEYEDGLPSYVWETEENLNVGEFDIRTMLEDTMLDMEILAGFISDIMGIEPENDDE